LERKLKQARAINSIASRLPPSSDKICARRDVRKKVIGKSLETRKRCKYVMTSLSSKAPSSAAVLAP